MRFLAVALDYDGTLASNGQVGVNTLAALRRARISGRKLLLVTGRELDSLLEVFPEAGLFDRVVAENGALGAAPFGGKIDYCHYPPACASCAHTPSELLLEAIRTHKLPTFVRMRVDDATTGAILIVSSGDWHVSEIADKSDDEVKELLRAWSGGKL